MENITRRRFVIQSSRLLAFIPLAGVISCAGETKLSAQESLKRLIYIIGPWSQADQSMAEDFANRFLETPFAKPYLPKSVSLIQSLSKQLQFDRHYPPSCLACPPHLMSCQVLWWCYTILF